MSNERIQHIMWPLPPQQVEAQTGTTIVITGKMRVLIDRLLIASIGMDGVQITPFVEPSTAGRVFEPGQPLRIGVLNFNRQPIVVRGTLECVALDANATAAQIEDIWASLKSDC